MHLIDVVLSGFADGRHGLELNWHDLLSCSNPDQLTASFHRLPPPVVLCWWCFRFVISYYSFSCLDF